MPGIIVDIGTGDGKFVYELAKTNPDKLIIGIDPNVKHLEKISLKVAKKSQKGGLPNALFVLASIEDLPRELDDKVNQVFINLPWGSLLEGITNSEEKTWQSLKRICKSQARIDILTTINHEFKNTSLERLGFTLASKEVIGAEKLKNYPSSWAKRLAYGKEKGFLHLRLTRL